MCRDDGTPCIDPLRESLRARDWDEHCAVCPECGHRRDKGIPKREIVARCPTATIDPDLYITPTHAVVFVNHEGAIRSEIFRTADLDRAKARAAAMAPGWARFGRVIIRELLSGNVVPWEP